MLFTHAGQIRDQRKTKTNAMSDPVQSTLSSNSSLVIFFHGHSPPHVPQERGYVQTGS